MLRGETQPLFFYTSGLNHFSTTHPNINTNDFPFSALDYLN